MSARILRHELPHYNRKGSNRFHLNMHAGATILNVSEIDMLGLRRQKDQPIRSTEFALYLWAAEDISIPVERRDFRFVQDGERLDWINPEDLAWRHVATFTSISGTFWAHIIETTGLVVTEVQTGHRRPTTGRGDAAEED